MTAISKSWVVVTDAASDADSPVDQALVQGLRDDLVNLDERMGGVSYPAGRGLQNHNHDGVNSALVEIGPNAIRNGSFEDGTNGWTITPYTGGSFTTNTANDMDGANALAITSTVTANGGAVALSGEFRSCMGSVPLAFVLKYKASVANVSSRARIIWYSDAQAQISTNDIYTSTNTPTVETFGAAILTAPSTARFYKVELTGGIPGSGSAAGTIYFDGVKGEQSLVRSVNGLTGNVAHTSVYAIGSFIVGRPADASLYPVGTTLGGSSLYSCSPGNYYDSGGGAWFIPTVTLVNTGSWNCVSPAEQRSGTSGYPGLWVRYA
jgi:hypothetical protein